MTCKSVEFKKFQRRIGRTLYYANCGRKQQALAQMMRKVSDCFNFANGYGADSCDFDEMIDKLSFEGFASPCNILTALVYIIRLRKTNGEEFDQFNATELYVSSLMLAGKFLNDGTLKEFVWNDEWASASGWNLNKLNELELRLLNSLGWDVSISMAEFENVLNDLEQFVAVEMAWRNGIMSYNEVLALSNSRGLGDSIRYLLTILLKIATVLTVIYLVLAANLIAFRFSDSCKLDNKSSLALPSAGVQHYPQNVWLTSSPENWIHLNTSFAPSTNFSFYFLSLPIC